MASPAVEVVHHDSFTLDRENNPNASSISSSSLSTSGEDTRAYLPIITRGLSERRESLWQVIKDIPSSWIGYLFQKINSNVDDCGPKGEGDLPRTTLRERFKSAWKATFDLRICELSDLNEKQIKLLERVECLIETSRVADWKVISIDNYSAYHLTQGGFEIDFSSSISPPISVSPDNTLTSLLHISDNLYIKSDEAKVDLSNSACASELLQKLRKKLGSSKLRSQKES